MAFFTRVNLNVPVLPPEDVGSNGTCPAISHTHRRYASEPVTSVHSAIMNSTMRPNSVSGASSAVKSGVVVDRSVVNVNENEVAEINTKNKASVNAKGRPTVESSAPSSENGESEVPKSSEKNGNGEPKRYEYVVDRVLGVEV